MNKHKALGSWKYIEGSGTFVIGGLGFLNRLGRYFGVVQYSGVGGATDLFAGDNFTCEISFLFTEISGQLFRLTLQMFRGACRCFELHA